jgi:hypothetical protein
MEKISMDEHIVSEVGTEANLETLRTSHESTGVEV